MTAVPYESVPSLQNTEAHLQPALEHLAAANDQPINITLMEPEAAWRSRLSGDEGKAWIGKIGVITAAGVGLLVALPNGCSGTSYHLDKYGTAQITSIKVGKGYYCNSEFTAHGKGIQSTASHRSLIYVTSTISEELTSGDFTSKVCLEFDSLDVTPAPKGSPDAGKMVVKLVTDGDPAKSNVDLIMYEADPTQIKYKASHNWVSGLGNLGVAFVNAIPGVNTDEGNSTRAVLEAIDQVQAYNLISKTCGDLAIQKLTSSSLPGGNMQAHLFADLIKLAKAQHGVTLKPSDFVLEIVSHHNGLPSQYDEPTDVTGKNQKPVHYDSVLAKIEKENKGIKFPTYAQMMKKNAMSCGDPINGGAPAPAAKK